MKDFRAIFSKYPTDKPKYADFYSRLIGSLSPSLLMEIGVLFGGSMMAWREIFPEARIVGIDIERKIRDDHPDLEVYVGDQTDEQFLTKIISKIGQPDIIIDDGGHSRAQQVGSFKCLFPLMKSGSIYVIEDLETCLLNQYNNYPKSTIDVIKDLILPTDYNGSTVGNNFGHVFNYLYKSITFEYNICSITKK